MQVHCNVRSVDVVAAVYFDYDLTTVCNLCEGEGPFALIDLPSVVINLRATHLVHRH